MTVKIMTTIQTWVGVSGDSKPSSPAAGSTFLETDTKKKFIYTGSAWTVFSEKLKDATIYLVGADLTTDGIAYSDEKQTTTLNTDITVYEYTFEPESGGGSIVWVYFNIIATLKGADAEADLKMTMEVRNKDGTWQKLFAQVTYTDINTSYLDKRYEGYLVKDAVAYCTPGDSDLWTYFNEVPFDFRVLLQAADTNDGYGKIKNGSLIRVVYNME